MLHSFSQYPSSANGQVAIFETPISHVASFITGHRVGGLALCPASVYLEQVYAGLDLTMRHLGVDSSGGQPILRDIQFSKPLVYHETVERVIVTSIEFGASSGSFSISSRVGASEESVHCHGVYKVQPSARMKSKFAHSLPGIERRIDALLQPHCKQPEMFTTRTVYDVIFPRVVKYSKEYQTIKSLCVSADGFEGFANVELLSQSSLIVEPVFVDTLLHAAGFIANMQGGPEDGYICSEVGAVRILPKSIKPDTPYTVYCSNSWIPERNTILAEAFALTSERKVVAHLKGMHFKRMRLRSFVSVLKAAAEGNIQLNDIVKGKTDLTTISATVRFKPTHSASTGPDFISSVISVVAEACALDVTDVKPDSELSELGVDSLMTIEIVQNLRKILPDSCIDSFAFSNLYSVRQIAEEIRARIDKPSATSTFSTPACSTPTQIDDCAMLFPSDELNIKAIISSVLDISIHDVEDDRELDSLGLDSLTSIEALAALREQSSLDVPTDLFLSCKTTRALQEFFAARAHSQNVTSSGAKAALRPENIPLLIQNPDQRTTKGSAPLILFHDGSGLTNYYNGLPPLNRLVWAINNPRFETGEPWQSIQQMTTDYADRVQRLGQNQVILGGWSFGGVAAYETCVQLQTRGVNVKGIILIDTPEPFDHVPLSEALISAVVSLERSESGIRKLVKAQFAMNSRLLTSYCAQALGDACPPLIFLRSKEGFRHPEIPNIPRWLADRSNPESTTQGWRKLAGSRLTVLDIPGDHFGPFNRTNAAEVFGTIQRALGLLDKP